MKVTIKWTNPEKDGKVRALCNVEMLQGSLTLYGVKIINSDGKFFAASQSVKGKDGGYYPTAFIGDELSESIVAETREAMKAKPKKTGRKDDDLAF